MTTRKIVLVVGALILAVCLLVLIFVGGIVGFAFYTVGKSEAATRAKDFLKASPVLKQDIGDVKDFGSFVTGSINVQNEDGAATLNLKVIGAKKVVNATVNLAYNGRTWRVSSASYVNDRGQTVNLRDPYESKLMSDTLQFLAFGLRPLVFGDEAVLRPKTKDQRLKCIEHGIPHAA